MRKLKIEENVVSRSLNERIEEEGREEEKGHNSMSSAGKQTQGASGGSHGSRAHKSNIQYVAKVRYSNNLPPPTCPPKLLKDSNKESEKELSEGDLNKLVDKFFRKENFRNLIRLNDDLGMDLNLVDLPSRETIFGIKTSNGTNLPLHPLDQLLLADPSKNIKTKSENVGFLRKTQYISSDINNQQQISNKSKIINLKKANELNAKNQLKTVVDMFNNPPSDISKIRHPTKKHLKAKKVWKFLPDTSMLDKKFYEVKFMSSASISKNRDKTIKSIDDPRLLTSLFREIELNNSTKLVSFYLSSKDDAVKIKEKIDDETENAPIGEEELNFLTSDLANSSKFDKQRDYDGSVKPVEDLRQLAITFDESTNNAYYIPISGKMELKKCRIDPYLIPKIKELTYDQINMFITEPTKSEIESRDSLRSKYDPMEFGLDEDEE